MSHPLFTIQKVAAFKQQMAAMSKEDLNVSNPTTSSNQKVLTAQLKFKQSKQNLSSNNKKSRPC